VLLLVEDNEVNQLLRQALLERLGCTVDIAPDGAEAISAAGRRRYDLRLMNAPMSVLDGHEATRRLCAGSRMPIVALTATADGHASPLAVWTSRTPDRFSGTARGGALLFA
jgi:two-component system, sensor histidine kinase and response regulator